MHRVGDAFVLTFLSEYKLGCSEENPVGVLGLQCRDRPQLDLVAIAAEDRPGEDFVVIHSTPEMTAEAGNLLACGAYAWFDRPPARDEKQVLLRALATSVGALADDITITEHFPEPFFVRFKYPHHHDAAVASHDFPFESLRVQVRPWRLEDNAEQITLQHHVRLCIENVPSYAWTDLAAQQIIGRACSLDYIEPRCKTKEHTKALCLWAWTENPKFVQRVRWVTLPGPNGVPGVRERGRRGLQRRCIIHLDIDEDLTGPIDEPPPPPVRYTWRYGHLDGDRSARDQTERIQDGGNDRRDRPRDRDDEDRDRRGRNSSRSWRETLRRSLSRNSRGRDGGADRRERERDRSSNRGGNRDAGRQRNAATHDIATTSLLQEAAEVLRARGRSRARSASPGSSRRRSRAALSPPGTPDPASPTSVCPSPPPAATDAAPFFLLSGGCGSEPTRVSLSQRTVHSPETRRLLEFLAPDSLVLTPSRPPGFDLSPVLQPASPVVDSGSGTGTPASASPPHVAATGTVPGAALGSLFTSSQQPLLSPPVPAPRRRALVNRRKTLAGVDIVRTVSPRRSSGRIKEKRKAKPVASAAETAVCRGLGIVQDGEEVTEMAMAEFARRFHGEVSANALAVLRVLFRVATPEDDAVDEALLGHGGAAGLDHVAQEGDAATADV